MGVYNSSRTLADKIDHLRLTGSSLTMNWGEDTDAWEVDWITAGERFRGVERELGTALDAAQQAAVSRFRAKAADSV